MKINDSGIMPNEVSEEGVNKDCLEDCKRFLRLVTPIKMPISCKQGWFSYGLKHVIEHWVGRYVSNGACIKAAIELGFPILQLTDRTGGSLNAQIGVSRKSVKWVCGMKKDNPNGKLVVIADGRMSPITAEDLRGFLDSWD